MADILEITPSAKDMRYGKLLNRQIQLVPDDWWICVRDKDTQYLIPEQYDMPHQAIEDHPDVSLFTCATNRVWGKPLSEESDMKWHIEEAKRRAEKKSYKYVDGCIPAFFWLFSKRTWLDNPFDGHPIIYGKRSFDARWSMMVKGKKMEIGHLYLFHLYRLGKNRSDYSHLKC